jgi:two-component system, NtrC family, nitrogen regulation sensor histidine kinase NtrY
LANLLGWELGLGNNPWKFVKLNQSDSSIPAYICVLNQALKKLIALFLFLSLGLAMESNMGAWLQQVWLAYQSNQANLQLQEFRSTQVLALQQNSFLQTFQNLKEKANKGFHTYLYVKGNLVLWSDNQENMALDESALFRLGKIWIETSEGFYLSAHKNEEDTLLLSLFKIESHYPVNNSYLKNTPNPNLGWNIQSMEVLPNKTDREGLPKLNILETKVPFLSILSLLCWISAFLLFAQYLQKANPIWKASGIGTLLGGRLIGLYFQVPYSIHSIDWFTPQDYAYAWWSPSIGDWFLNALLFFWVSNLLRNWLKERQLSNLQQKIFFLGASILGPLVLLWSIQNICTHSEFFLDPAVLVKLRWTSWLAIAGLCLIGWGIFRLASLHQFSGKEKSILLLVAALVTESFAWFHWNNGLVCLTLLSFYFGLFAYFIFTSKGLLKSPSTQIAVAGVCLSLFLSLGLHHFNLVKESAEVEYLAGKLVSGRDWVQEYLFKKISQRIKTDRNIKNALSIKPVQANLLNEAIRSQFKDEWSNFELGFILHSEKDSMIVRDFPNNGISLEEVKRIKSEAEPTETNGLWLVSPGQKFVYLAEINLTTGRGEGNQTYQLFLLFWQKASQNTIGYPDLLLEKGIGFKEQLQYYSYRVTQHDSLIAQNFVHWQNNAIFQKSVVSTWKKWKDQDLYWKIYSNNGDTQVEITRPNPAFASYLNAFTVLFSFFFVLGIISALLSHQFSIQDFLFQSFRNRIIIATTGLLTLTLFTIGFASARLMVRQIEHKNTDLAEEKISTLRNRMEKEQRISNSFLLDLAQESNVDIHVFDAKGILHATSRPVIFRDGYCGKMMNPEAKQGLENPFSEDSFLKEHIGHLSFLSAYTKFKVQNQTFYLNIPLFAKQEEIREELSSMVSSLLNIYFILVALSVVLTLIISGYITSPLETMAEKLGKVDLKKPEYIQWKGEDEIGKLVKAYNHMVDELGKSVEELAKSERESAWREMAKQVAHEIKNPLTPMKLQVQHLILRYKSNSPGWEEQMVKTMNLLEEQIDNLANIATAFSNFAKMPLGLPERFDAKEILQNLFHLHQNETAVALSMNLPAEQVWINMDKQQFSRAIQNVIKNAIQSIPGDRQGEININCWKKGQHFWIEIKDNGSGIQAEVQEKIFMPNFTTKSSGMGLGLAMVKNIVDQAQGQISFVTVPNQGTTFTIQLPLIS